MTRSEFIKQSSAIPALASFLGVSTLIGTGQTQYVKRVAEPSWKANKDEQLYEAIKNEVLKDKLKLTYNNAHPSSHYNPRNKEVVITDKQKSPGVLAHELGHHRAGPTVLKAHGVGNYLSSMLGMTVLLGKSAPRSKALALTSTGLFAPVLLSESLASKKGYDILKSKGADDQTARSAFAGLPTYALQALVPGLFYKGKKLLRGFNP